MVLCACGCGQKARQHGRYAYGHRVAQNLWKERIQCRICGRWYIHVGVHAWGAHGMLADDYREEFGLNRKQWLTSEQYHKERSEWAKATDVARQVKEYTWTEKKQPPWLKYQPPRRQQERERARRQIAVQRDKMVKALLESPKAREAMRQAGRRMVKFSPYYTGNLTPEQEAARREQARKLGKRPRSEAERKAIAYRSSKAGMRPETRQKQAEARRTWWDIHGRPGKSIRRYVCAWCRQPFYRSTQTGVHKQVCCSISCAMRRRHSLERFCSSNVD